MLKNESTPTFHICPIDELSCPYYRPTIKWENTCCLETADIDCDAFYEWDFDDEGEGE